MKKLRFLLFFLLLPVLLCGCSTGNSDSETEKSDISVIVKALDSDFWHSVKKGVDSAATEYNASVSFEGPENEEDFESQNVLIDNAVKRGTDAIVISAIDYEKNAEAVNRAAQSGVKIIAIDSGVNSPHVSMFIGTDNTESGRAAGKAAVQHASGNERLCIGIVNSYKSTDNISKREKSFREYISGIPNAEITASVSTANSVASAEAGASALLRENPQINVLAGFNEWTTLGVGNAISKLSAAGKVRGIGFDTNAVSVGMLETGEMDTLIVQNPFAIGYLGVKNAAELISGSSIKIADIYTAVTAVTRDNLFDSEIQKLVFSFEND